MLKTVLENEIEKGVRNLDVDRVTPPVEGAPGTFLMLMVSHLCLVNAEGKIHRMLLLGKRRLAPIKQIRIQINWSCVQQ